MNDLWGEKQEYEYFNSEQHSIAALCGGRCDDYLPYLRQYGTLNQEQLKVLIQDAKQYHWQALDLSFCGLADLPDELWELEDLKILYLGNSWNLIEDSSKNGSKNTFSIIPQKIEQLKNLQVLSFHHLPLINRGERPLKLEKLVYLDIFGCGFFEFPKMFLIPSLKAFGFDCQGEHLLKSITPLRNLRQIYLTGSNISELPEDIGELPYLESLYLWDCKITSLPESLSEAVSLINFEIINTPLAKSLPPEILNQSAKEIIYYILSQQSNTLKYYFNESKMIIVGQGHVGKSCVLNRLVNNVYTEKPSTEGIAIAPWYFKHNRQRYKLNVWDFGGQEIYHSTHQFFLTERSLYLLVWDALAEDEYGRIDYWLKTIQSFAADSPVIIVVNKCDRGIGRIQRIDEQEYKERFPQIKEVVYVSCKDGIKIGYLRKIVQSVAIKLPLMKTSWLSSWMDVRKKLECISQNKNFIPYNEYLDICESENIKEEEAMSLIKYLHDLGIVLYYHEDPLLKNLVILSSEWGTDAVYKVLDEQERILKGRNGILRTQDLPNIWKDTNQYPHRLHPYLLNLMNKFQLTFKISDTTYLVAELLNNKAIELGWSFEYGETLSFRYVYDFLPAGIMTRFIVMNNAYLETINGMKQCWRKGAYLRYKSAYALVRLYDNTTDRYIHIMVSGSRPRDKRELLTIIRTVFDEINNQFKQIKITERIPCICDKDCDFLFDYETLLKAEQIGKLTIECHRSLKSISIGKILDGVDTYMNSDYGTVIISPNFYNNNNNTAAADSTATNVVLVTTEVREWINELHGGLNDLKDEVGDQSEEFNSQLQKVVDNVEKIEKSESKEEIQRTGAMSRIRRFLAECNDSESQIGKMLTGIKYAAGIINELASKYNKIAKWMMLPQLPFGES